MPREKLSVEMTSYAKVNLFLDIESQRVDGFHELSMVNSKISLHDTVTCSLNSKIGIDVTCSDPTIPVDERNTAYQAASRFREQSRFNKGIIIHIEKRIPVGSGLGGGSSNAAAVLLALNQLTFDRIPPSALHKIAEGIGTDVPFFLESGICVCSGRGERVVAIHLAPLPDKPPLYGVLCSPDDHVSTSVAYKLWDRSKRHKSGSARYLLNALLRQEWNRIPKHLFNTFESVVYEEYEEVKQAYEAFKSVSPVPPILTGTGSNLYSLHPSEKETKKVIDQLNKKGFKARPFHLIME